MVAAVEPDIYIVVPNRNGRELLRECIESVLKTTRDADIEIIVVDDNSDDDSVSMVEEQFPDVHLLRNDHRQGVAGSYNRGFRYALKNGADYVLRLDNDMQIQTNGWTTELLAVLERDDTVGAVGCEVVFPDGTVHSKGRYFPFTTDEKYEYEYNRFQREETPSGYRYVDDVGPSALYSREVLEAAGLFDERFSPYWGEESDLYVRIWDAGYRIAYTSNVTFIHDDHTHHEYAETDRDPKWEFLIQRNRIRFYLLNYPTAWAIDRTLTQVKGSATTVLKEPTSLLTATWIYLSLVLELSTLLVERRRRRSVKELLK